MPLESKQSDRNKTVSVNSKYSALYDRRRRTTRQRCTARHSMGTRKWWHSCCNTDATPASATAGENPRWISPRNMAGKLHVRFFSPPLFSPALSFLLLYFCSLFYSLSLSLSLSPRLHEKIHNSSVY